MSQILLQEWVGMKARLLILILLLPLMANMTVSAQAPTAAISLSCTDFEFDYIYNQSLTNEYPVTETTCVANNPTTYQEKISIQITTEHDVLSTAPAELYVGGNSQVEFQVSIRDSFGKHFNDYICQSCFNVNVTVQESNSLPPVNSASATNSLSISVRNMVDGLTIGMPVPLLNGATYSGENWTNSNSSFDGHFDSNLITPFNQPWTALQFMDTDCPYCVQSAQSMDAWSNKFDPSNFTNGMPEVQFLVSATQLNLSGHNSSREEIEAFRDKTPGYECAGSDCSSRPGSAHNLITYIDDLDQDNMMEWTVSGTPSYVLVQPDGIFAWTSSGFSFLWNASSNTPYFFEVSNDEIKNLSNAIMELISTSDQPFQPDSDGDGISDGNDVFPDDENESEDTDGDGVGDNSDAFPTDGNETHDDDGDGVGNNTDAFPQDGNETHDDDGDGVGNNTDAFPQDENETLDTDLDGVGDNEDPEPENPDIRTPQDISVEISDQSSYIIAGSIVLLAIVILFVRKQQPPQAKNDSHFVEEDSMWND